jgi:acyl CoA:acetate/3-ketoacid CoA transferase alpha subunit/acyl CoA:acetate/3-ketoacid CoA transferase beta subunit
MRPPIVAADPDDLVRRLVRPGDHVHLAGTPSRPNALTYALCRVLGPHGRLTVSTTAVHSAAHALALSGVAEKVIAGFVGDTYPSPRPNPLYADLAAGRPFTFEAWSLLSYVQRLMAGALGLPYAVTASLAGTDLAEGKTGELRRVADPAQPDRQLTLLTPLRPDVTLVHGVCADEDGNVALVPPLGEGAWAAYAARRGVIASVERIVPHEQMRALADRVVIPGQRVLGLCEAPFGAHPQSLRTAGLCGITGYLDDYDFLTSIVASCEGPERGADWYRAWVVEPGSHAGYLERLGAERRSALLHRPGADRDGDRGADLAEDRDVLLRDDAQAAWEELAAAEVAAHQAHLAAHEPSAGAPGAGLRAPEPASAPRPAAPDHSAAPDTRLRESAQPSRQERLIVLGARAVADLVRQHGYDTLLAGIGASHMAAWLAAALLRRGGHEVKVVAELGMYGFTPQGGDVFLFSLAHAERSEMLAGIPEILGGMVAANPRALGVLAAAEIDETGTVNTSRTADGRWLTGSGGANDIASTTDCVVIAPSSRRRYVPRVHYRTSPGHRVREVVSDFGRFRRDTDGTGFRLATWLPDPGEAEEAGETVRSGTGLDERTGPQPDPVERLARDLVARRTAWTAPVAGLITEKPVTAEELELLRGLDPDGHHR